MEACLVVERDIEEVLQRFTSLKELAEKVCDDVHRKAEQANEYFQNAPDEIPIPQYHLDVIKDVIERCQHLLEFLSPDHRNTHCMVSRVGKCIDRNFVSELSGAVPRDALFSAPEQKPLLDRAVAQHLYRQGLDAVADTLVREAGLDEETGKGEPFAGLHKIVEALTARDPGPALAWAKEHEETLHNSQLPFKLHRLAFLLTARRDGPLAAVLYARQHFPQFVSRHEKEIQRTMCLLAYEGGKLPESYASLKDEILWSDVVDLFLRDACALLRLPPLSPLQSAVTVGSKVLPTLLDIRMKMAHTHVHQAWGAKDELPVSYSLYENVDMEAGGHHSVFACPILRQQGSEQNPPMRLLCGHVISKDALTKLCQGIKLKCPYCPQEQSQSEARLIYF